MRRKKRLHHRRKVRKWIRQDISFRKRCLEFLEGIRRGRLGVFIFEDPKKHYHKEYHRLLTKHNLKIKLYEKE